MSFGEMPTIGPKAFVQGAAQEIKKGAKAVLSPIQAKSSEVKAKALPAMKEVAAKGQIHASIILGKVASLAREVGDVAKSLLGIKSPAEKRLEKYQARHEIYKSKVSEESTSLTEAKQKSESAQGQLKKAQDETKQARSALKEAGQEEKFAKAELEKAKADGAFQKSFEAQQKLDKCTEKKDEATENLKTAEKEEKRCEKQLTKVLDSYERRLERKSDEMGVDTSLPTIRGQLGEELGKAGGKLREGLRDVGKAAEKGAGALKDAYLKRERAQFEAKLDQKMDSLEKQIDFEENRQKRGELREKLEKLSSLKESAGALSINEANNKALLQAGHVLAGLPLALGQQVEELGGKLKGGITEPFLKKERKVFAKALDARIEDILDKIEKNKGSLGIVKDYQATYDKLLDLELQLDSPLNEKNNQKLFDDGRALGIKLKRFGEQLEEVPSKIGGAFAQMGQAARERAGSIPAAIRFQKAQSDLNTFTNEELKELYSELGHELKIPLNGGKDINRAIGIILSMCDRGLIDDKGL